MKKFSYGEAIKFGWEKTKKHFWFFAGLMVLQGVVGNLPQVTNSATTVVLLAVISFILNALLQLAIIKAALLVVDGNSVTYANAFLSRSLFWPYVAASVMFGLASVVGFLLLIIPGVIINLSWMFYAYVLVDKKMGAWEALQESYQLTKGVRWQLLGFGLVLGLLNIAGALALFIGLLWTLPLSVLALTYVYRQLVAAQTPVVVPAQEIVTAPTSSL